MTTQQDSVDVERLRAAEARLAERGRFPSGGAVPFDVARDLIASALSLPITQRDEQGAKTYADGAQTERRAEAALAVAERLMQFTTHNIGCAVYRRSYASGLPTCTCGVDAAREAVTAIRRLSIEQGDQDGGEG